MIFICTSNTENTVNIVQCFTLGSTFSVLAHAEIEVLKPSHHMFLDPFNYTSEISLKQDCTLHPNTPASVQAPINLPILCLYATYLSPYHFIFYAIRQTMLRASLIVTFLYKNLWWLSTAFRLRSKFGMPSPQWSDPVSSLSPPTLPHTHPNSSYPELLTHHLTFQTLIHFPVFVSGTPITKMSLFPCPPGTLLLFPKDLGQMWLPI